MGQKTLTIELQDEIIEIPSSLNKYSLSFGTNKMSLIYTYNLQEKQTGITNLLQDIKDAGLKRILTFYKIHMHSTFRLQLFRQRKDWNLHFQMQDSHAISGLHIKLSASYFRQ